MSEALNTLLCEPKRLEDSLPLASMVGESLGTVSSKLKDQGLSLAEVVQCPCCLNFYLPFQGGAPKQDLWVDEESLNYVFSGNGRRFMLAYEQLEALCKKPATCPDCSAEREAC